MLYTALLCLVAVQFASISTVLGHTNSTPMTWETTLSIVLDPVRPIIDIDAVIKINTDKVLEGQSQSQSQGSTSKNHSTSTFRNSDYVHGSISTTRLSSRVRTTGTDSSSDHSASEDSRSQSEQSFLPSHGLSSRLEPELESQMTAITTDSAEIPADTFQRHSRIGETGSLSFLGTAFPWPTITSTMSNNTHHGNQSPSASRTPNLSIFTGLGPPLIAELPRYIIVLLAAVPLILMVVV